MQFDITMIGHVCKDTLYDMDEKSESLGGAVYFSSISAARTGASVQVVTMAAESDDSLLNVMRKEGVLVTRLESDQTTQITLKYDSPDRERREVILDSQAAPFAVAEMPEIDSSIYHLAGLFKGEIPDDFIPFLSNKGDVALDVQGVLRCSEKGNLVFKKWDKMKEMLPLIKYLKTDAAEAEVLTGEKDREKSGKILNEMGADEVMITHNEEVLICKDGEVIKAPFNPSNLSGRTGRGDTTFAAYLAKRLESDPYESLYYAAALCSIKMETPGPFCSGKENVYMRMDSIGYRKTS